MARWWNPVTYCAWVAEDLGPFYQQPPCRWCVTLHVYVYKWVTLLQCFPLSKLWRSNLHAAVFGVNAINPDMWCESLIWVIRAGNICVWLFWQLFFFLKRWKLCHVYGFTSLNILKTVKLTNNNALIVIQQSAQCFFSDLLSAKKPRKASVYVTYI